MAAVKGKGKRAAPKSSPSTASTSKSQRKGKGRGPLPTQQKTKSAKSLDSKKPRRRVYTAEELGVPKLNTITPVGVQKPRGKKKGKVFVDDPTILAMVNAETEGKIESKMLRAQQMEAIRDARQKEQEAKEQARKEVIENKKDELRKPRKKAQREGPMPEVQSPLQAKKKKRVSFAP